MKKGAKISDVVEAIATLNSGHIIVVMVDSPPHLTAKEQSLCRLNSIWFGLLTSFDSIRNLVTGKEYRVDYLEWPGSADDAATYGRWWLDELPPSENTSIPPEEMIDDMSFIQEMKTKLHRDILSAELSGSRKAVCSDFETQNEFFANITMTSFTPFHPLQYFDSEWRDKFENGRYVILVSERHSVYQKGKCIYCNENFTGTPDDVYCGNRPAYYLLPDSYYVSDLDLWNRTKTEYLTLEQACENAEKLSGLMKNDIAVVRVAKYYDMW